MSSQWSWDDRSSSGKRRAKNMRQTTETTRTYFFFRCCFLCLLRNWPNITRTHTRFAIKCHESKSPINSGINSLYIFITLDTCFMPTRRDWINIYTKSCTNINNSVVRFCAIRSRLRFAIAFRCVRCHHCVRRCIDEAFFFFCFFFRCCCCCSCCVSSQECRRHHCNAPKMINEMIKDDKISWAFRVSFAHWRDATFDETINSFEMDKRKNSLSLLIIPGVAFHVV